jgi:hypothetical protein
MIERASADRQREAREAPIKLGLAECLTLGTEHRR